MARKLKREPVGLRRVLFATGDKRKTNVVGPRSRVRAGSQGHGGRPWAPVAALAHPAQGSLSMREPASGIGVHGAHGATGMGRKRVLVCIGICGLLVPAMTDTGRGPPAAEPTPGSNGSPLSIPAVRSTRCCCGRVQCLVYKALHDNVRFCLLNPFCLLCRFGDTAANAGTLALLDSYDTTRSLPVRGP